MFSDDFKKDLEKVDNLVHRVTDLFNEEEVSPFVALAVAENILMVAQAGLDNWLEIHRQGKSNVEKKELQREMPLDGIASDLEKKEEE